MELLVAALIMKTSMRCNFVMEWETLRAACNNNIQQFLWRRRQQQQQPRRWQRGLNVAVWETCINPSLLWLSPAWKIEQGSAIKQPAQHRTGKVPTKLMHAPGHAVRSAHTQLHKNKTGFRAGKKRYLTAGGGGATRWIFNQPRWTWDNSRFELRSLNGRFSCSFISGSSNSSRKPSFIVWPVRVIIRYHLVDTVCANAFSAKVTTVGLLIKKGKNCQV